MNEQLLHKLIQIAERAPLYLSSLESSSPASGNGRGNNNLFEKQINQPEISFKKLAAKRKEKLG